MDSLQEFVQWKNEVVARLVERNVPISDQSLVIAWNSNHSVEYTVMAQEAEFVCGRFTDRFKVAKRCGCFYCQKFFMPDEIIRESGIPECPYCHIDAVLPETDDYPLTREMLIELSKKQFARNPFV